MRYVISLLLLVSIVFGHEASAQKSMMSGIVLDEGNNLVPGALIKLTRKKEASEVRVGEDGMYYSFLLPIGDYFVDIYVDNRFYTAKKVYLAETTEVTAYYNYVLQRNGTAELIRLVGNDKDPREMLKAGEHIPQSGK